MRGANLPFRDLPNSALTVLLFLFLPLHWFAMLSFHHAKVSRRNMPLLTRTIALIALLLLYRPALALEVIEKDHFFIYFPKGHERLASELLSECGPASAYLAEQGLPIKKPLHIVVDDRLDRPKARATMYPHREIRIPLRAPGILEDGSFEPHPWRYFLFMGLSAQGIYSLRSGIPGAVHNLFGEIISPNLILPDWGIEGIGFLLFEKFHHKRVSTPLADTILKTGPFPDIDKVSNHPEVWPGRFSHRIYGRPFIRWLDRRYGWQKLHTVLTLHGAGIVPFEIDLEAEAVYGKNWSQLWGEFRTEMEERTVNTHGQPITGYWHDPFIFWNDAGVYPGKLSNVHRGRYGVVGPQGRLWLSAYDTNDISRLKSQRGDSVDTAKYEHAWDPGPGGVAVTRRGGIPFLLIYPEYCSGDRKEKQLEPKLVVAPPGTIQLSGPVMDEFGRIAVSGNIDGNWDIWLFDGSWHRITNAPSIEMDPWLSKGKLLFASNRSGRFQIHTHTMQQLTFDHTAAILPRGDRYLLLGSTGWRMADLNLENAAPLDMRTLLEPVREKPTGGSDGGTDIAGESRPYSPFGSIWPNYISPDIFIDEESFQVGLATTGRDVTGRYAWDAGVRYSTDDALFSWRLGTKLNNWHLRTSHYPFSYTTLLGTGVNEIRQDSKLGWSPAKFKALEFSANWRHYAPRNHRSQSDNEWWGSISHRYASTQLRTSLTLDLFTEESQSLYGEIVYRFGERINTVMTLQAGKTWGDIKEGHNTFRIGGNTGEGFFTQRPTRLFFLRGFDNNALEAEQAASGGLEIFWPLFRLQTGYKTLPLFLHNIHLGTFADAGIADDRPASEDLLVGAGFELIMGMEIAWGIMAHFRVGLAWPLMQPDGLDQDGPVFLIQIGRPL